MKLAEVYFGTSSSNVKIVKHLQFCIIKTKAKYQKQKHFTTKKIKGSFTETEIETLNQLEMRKFYLLLGIYFCTLGMKSYTRS